MITSIRLGPAWEKITDLAGAELKKVYSYPRLIGQLRPKAAKGLLGAPQGSINRRRSRTPSPRLAASILSHTPHCLKEKCQLEAQKVAKLVMTITDDYVLAEGMKRELSGGRRGGASSVYD